MSSNVAGFQICTWIFTQQILFLFRHLVAILGFSLSFKLGETRLYK